MTTAQDIAAWLLERIRTEGRFSQDRAVEQIRETFGPEWVHTLENGHVGIHRDVLREFRKAHDGTVQWDRDRRFWAPRPR